VQAHVDAMMLSVPTKAYAKPRRARKVLVLAHAAGFVHSSIPLAAKMVEALGEKTSAWSTVITYDAADITVENLKLYDAIFLDSTTGAFLDDPADAAATAARKQALLDFVRGGKGLVGIHAATDAYHGAPPGTEVAARGGLAPGTYGASNNTSLWPDFNRMMGGCFKDHWFDPQLITVKIDDPKSPLTAMFKGQEWEIHDETYTLIQESFSRKNVHVLTSVDYAKMSASDKKKELNPRSDGDYALSYIRREGKGRVFYEAHGHNEKVYAMQPFLEHMLAGIQYALGDLKANDRPSER
jgi:type 1 glutamine amidotransferase